MCCLRSIYAVHSWPSKWLVQLCTNSERSVEKSVPNEKCHEIVSHEKKKLWRKNKKKVWFDRKVDNSPTSITLFRTILRHTLKGTKSITHLSVSLSLSITHNARWICKYSRAIQQIRTHWKSVNKNSNSYEHDAHSYELRLSDFCSSHVTIMQTVFSFLLKVNNSKINKTKFKNKMIKFNGFIGVRIRWPVVVYLVMFWSQSTIAHIYVFYANAELALRCNYSFVRNHAMGICDCVILKRIGRDDRARHL